MAVRLVALAGSTRAGSLNQRLVDQAAAIAEGEGARVTRLRLADFPLPMYSAELEASAFPEEAKALKALLASHDGFLIASPEHNGSVPVVLKNALDWASRPQGEESPIAFKAYRGKTCGLMSVSPSPFGGLRGLTHLRQILNILQVLIPPEQVQIPFGDRALEEGVLRDEPPVALLTALVRRVIALSR